MLVKDNVYNKFKVNVVDTSYEGILWVKFECRENPPVTFLVCVCYLPPSRSSRGDTSQEFFENLGNQYLLYSNLGPVCICGDLNARCGDHQDISHSEVYIPQRHILDHATNSHGLQLLDFLRPLDLCMFNGRGKDNFTYISSLGCSVCDYCLVPKEDYDLFSCFEVITIRDLETNLDHYDTLASDHSVLSWIVFQNITKSDLHISVRENARDKRKVPLPDFRKVPSNFLQNCEKDISLLSQQLMSSTVTQSLVDHIYNSFCKLLHSEIRVNIPTKRHRKPYKQPWWNCSLSKARKEVHKLQKLWAQSKGKADIALISNMKRKFRAAHLRYMYMIRRAKRHHQYITCTKLLGSITRPTKFWELSSKILGRKRAKFRIPVEYAQGEEGCLVKPY